MSTSSQLPGLPGYDPQNVQPWVVSVMAAMSALAVLTVGLRMASRYIKGQGLWWDDYMILFSTLWYFLVVGFIFAMYNNGMGIHADLVEVNRIVNMAKWLLVAEIFYAWNLGWTKISLLLMYYRIFHIPYFKRMAWILGAFVMAWVVTITFIFIFICVPVEKLWYPDVPGHCINQVGTWIANAASTIFSDLAILLLPIPQIWKLQLRQIEKVGLTVAFGIGFFVVFTSAYRTSVLFSYSNTDPTYTLAPTVGWTAIEITAGIISACLPTLLPILRIFFRSIGVSGLFSGNRSSHGAGGGTSQGSKLATIGSYGPNLHHRRTESSGSGQDGTAMRNLGGATGKPPFYRLPDDGDSTISRDHHGNSYGSSNGDLHDLQLRPDIKNHRVAVKTYASKAEKEDNTDDDNSADHVPLNGIRVHNDLRQSTHMV